jgi:nitrate/nitrite-specific signal transduction histidine kinase
MAKKLVIVESPAKAKTIGGYLGGEYEVESSIGHIRDLPNRASDVPQAQRKRFGALGVDVDEGFEPYYVVDPDKKKVVTALKKHLEGADEVLLATDEDREGEAIAWHLLEVLKPKVPVRRMVFHEITKDAIQEALAEIRTLSRGIAPPILTERGLRAAVTALAARGVIPTTVDIDEELDQTRSLSDAAQNAVYFVVAESLANKEKYSRASTCSVELRRLGGLVVITITDDGVGGASVAKGHGLAGLTDRLAGVDGNLHVSSPAGGPTMITATVPVNAIDQRAEGAPGMR